MDTIESVILQNVYVQSNGIIRNSKGRLIGRLVDSVDYTSEHINMTNEPEWIENNDIGRQAKPCEHYMGWNILEGHSYYRCMNCTYIDGEKSFKEEIEKAKSELLSKIEEEVKGMKIFPPEIFNRKDLTGVKERFFNKALDQVIKSLSKYKTL